MSDVEPIELDEDERDAHLNNGGTGVISFSELGDDPPHSIPVSYGYDATETAFYFRLAVNPDSAKGNISDRAITFVVHGQENDEWWSVVAKGQLEETTEESIATETLQGFQNVHIPFVDIFGRPPKDVSFEFYRLVADELTSRKESGTTV
ncbi:pyridoxamine 5'-phosphate oxidase family protein [Halosimplex amylolyticum]|uniref:pyridoxamine 5'-phosphate oxidase family protein n=1 Tax=Halosimplex amylolyticum TaxID=3396616 RepID=UPI003F56EB38